MSPGSGSLPDDVSELLGFLPCRTPAGWIEAAVADVPTLLLDHASLELKAAQQAQKLIWNYGFGSTHKAPVFSDGQDRLALLSKLSRLSREELRHFEQVLAALDERDIEFKPVSASRYAAGLHKLVSGTEPGRLVDLLVVGAVIEARSCERFLSLVPALEAVDARLSQFYSSLLKSEARHFKDYLELAERFSPAGVATRIAEILDEDKRLVLSEDGSLRFHSGNPADAHVAQGRA